MFAMRNFIVLSCFFSVLACPYQCAIRQVAGAIAKSEASVVCCEGCCTQKNANSSQDESPQPPLPEEDGLSCFCDGTVFCNADQADLSLDTQVIFVPWTDSALTPELLSRTRVQESSASTLETLDSKSMRISLRSLQL